MPHKYISATGTVDIHAAMESGIAPSVLAVAKNNWIATGPIKNDANEMLNRLVSYSKRVDAAGVETSNAPLGSDRHRGYSYRFTYYTHLTKLLQADLATVLDAGLQHVDI